MQGRYPLGNTLLTYRSKAQPLAAMLLMAVILVLGVVGVMSPWHYNILPAVPLLELAVLGVSALVFPPKSRSAWLFMLAAGGYLVVTLAIAQLMSGSHILDYVQAYKAFFYVLLLCSFIARPLFKQVQVVKFFYVLLGLFFLKYAYSRLIGLDAWVSQRPGIFTENNFELVLLILLLYLVLPVMRWRFVSIVAVMLIIFLSGSRSAFLCFLAVYVFSVFRVGKGFIKPWLLLFPLLVLLAYGIVNDRMDITLGSGADTAGENSSMPAIEEGRSLSMEEGRSPATTLDSDREVIEQPLTFRSFLERGASIDRVRFLLYFLDEVEGWQWWNVMLGTQPLTPLSTQTCEALSYWSDLYSFSGDGTCYSVILHSYIIRVLYDHGVLGLIFLVAFTVFALRKSGYSWADTLCVLGVLMASSLSVSAFNSVFAMLSMMFYLSYGIGEQGSASSAEASGDKTA
ncbi:hypothetical protein J4377_11815 [Halomonas sp. XH26]|uniref:hypothetical protein n=1 Tax=Halomonas sp. XH26 TaxID=2557993 RepID=UPI0020A15877|nr:hypothetical protein [Halomonas sp. XH26]UTA78652.1 hypothetical protein J4377_11815 [Halomonas sp. XH26]